MTCDICGAVSNLSIEVNDATTHALLSCMFCQAPGQYHNSHFWSCVAGFVAAGGTGKLCLLPRYTFSTMAATTEFDLLVIGGGSGITQR